MKKLMLIVVAVLLVSITAMAQNQAPYVYAVAAVGTGLTVEAGDVTLDPAYAGVCYEITPDPLGVTSYNGLVPITNDEEVAITAAVIAGDPFGDIIVSCSMPTILLGEPGRLELNYTGTSACWHNTSSDDIFFFNPTSGPISILLDDGGETEIWIGFNTCIPKMAYAGGAWEGEGVITAQYK